MTAPHSIGGTKSSLGTPEPRQWAREEVVGEGNETRAE